MDVFADRTDAGKRLAERLQQEPHIATAERVVVLGIPRGGLPVGAEVAKGLGAPLDVALVRKLRSPANPELGFGAVDADGHVEIDDDSVQRLGLSHEQVDNEIADRQEAIAERLALYREATERAALDGACVVVVDDGIATGGTARQACAFARRAGARTVVLAAPVGPPDVEERLADAADVVIVLSKPAEFLSVGQAYEDFHTLDDQTAVQAIKLATAEP